MYDWERETIGIDTLGQIRHGLECVVELEPIRPESPAWWIGTLFGPEVWLRWRVGLLRSSLSVRSENPLPLPDPAVFRLPNYLVHRTASVTERWDRIALCPVILVRSALGFIATGSRDREDDGDLLEPRGLWEIVGPTDLRERLGLVDGKPLNLQILPASIYSPHPSRDRR